MVLTVEERNEAIEVGNLALSRNRSAGSVILGTDLNREQRALVKNIVQGGRFQQRQIGGERFKEKGRIGIKGLKEKEILVPTTQVPRFQGPTRPETDVQRFRETGRSEQFGSVEQPIGEVSTDLPAEEDQIAGFVPSPRTEQDIMDIRGGIARGELTQFGGGLGAVESVGFDTDLGFGREPMGIIQRAPEPEGFLETRLEQLRRFSGRTETKKLRGDDLGFGESVGLLGAGFGTSLLETAIFGKQLITSPIKTTTGLGLGIASVVQDPFGAGAKIGTIARERPLFATGLVVGEIIAFKGTQVVVTKGLPKARGLVARTETGFKEVQVTAKGEQIITGLEGLGGKGELALIPPGKGIVKGGTLLPSLRGGFGFSKAEQAKFIGAKGAPVTSARDLFGFRKGELLVAEGEGGMGLFATPGIEGKAFARVSRLGLEDVKSASFADLLSGDFAFRKPASQIVAFPGEKVGRPGGFQPFGLPSGELEVTLKPGTAIRRTEQLGITTIQGKRVPIIGAEIFKAPPELSSIISKTRGGAELTRPEARSLFKATGFRSSDLAPSRPVISLPSFGGTTGLSLGTKLSPGLALTTGGFSLKVLQKSLTGLSPPTRGTGFFGFGSPPVRGSQLLRGSGFPGLPGTPVRGSSPFISPGTPRPFLLPSFEFGFKPKKPKRVLGIREFLRRPSLVSAEFGIFAEKPLPLEFTGIGARPIIRKKKRRSKK